jgi:hypothetical protein
VNGRAASLLALFVTASVEIAAAREEPPGSPPAPAADPAARPAAAVSVSGFDGRIVARFDQASLLCDLPSGHDYASLLETTEPMAVFDRIGGAGLYADAPARFSMRGTSWAQNTFRLDGADITDPLHGGAPLLVPDVDALQEVEAVSALARVDTGSPGVTLELTPRQSGGRWQGTAQGSGVPSALQGHAPAGPSAIARFGSLVDLGAVASGPLSGDRLSLVLSARATRVRRLEREALEPREGRVLSGSARLGWSGERDRLSLLAAAQAIERPLAGAAGLDGDAARERAGAGGGTLRWSRPGDRVSFSALSGLWSAGSMPLALPGSAPRSVDRLVDGPVPLLVLPSHSRRSVWSSSATATLASGALGRLTHAPRLGVELERAWSEERPGDTEPIAEAVAGLPARVWEYTWAGRASRRHSFAAAAWGSERLAWRDRLWLEAGLRLEHASGSAEGAAGGVSWTTLAPRVSARLRLADAGRLSLVGGYGEYSHRLLLDWLAFGDPDAPQAAVYRWLDVDGDGRFSAGERGPLVARVGPGNGDGSLATVDPALRPPRTRELVAGLTASPGGGWVVSLTGFDRRERDLVESVNVGAPASAYDVRYLPDPGGDILGSQDDQLLPVFDRRPDSFGLDRYRLTNPPGLGTRHQAVELRAQKPLGARIALLAGATASRTEIDGAFRGFRVSENDQGLVGELLDDPNAGVYARGRGFFDRAFTIKLAGAWRAPGDVRVGAVARYQDGQPFARVVVVPDLAQGPEAVQATPRGQIGPTGAVDPQGRPLDASGHRFAYTLTLDLRLEKGVRLGRARAALVAEAFNLLGARNEVEEDPVWGERFRLPTALQPPRALRLGARLDF